MEILLPLIIVLPLIGSLILGLIGFYVPSFRTKEKLIGVIASLAVAIPFLLLVGVCLQFDEPITFQLFSWMKVGSLEISFSYYLDQLSILMGLIITGVGALIHIYSIGYMHGDKGYYKYFTYLNLFVFAMMNLVMGSNMVVMFLGWEGVGLCSYLLIGFWYADMEKSRAAQKAFIVNRIGDFALMIAMIWIFRETGSLDFITVNEVIPIREFAAFGIAMLVFLACTGKSAQIPLFVWLPDAMAGPTPVSALIHAATMVTAGIYLIARMHPIYLAAPEIMLFIAIVACLTALIAALTALAQNDIKKVLAYSTVSQLGFMFMALGVGAFTTAIFHVMTHAFFKACLFLGAGSVIHAMEHMNTVEDPQDIRTMGGLAKHMPQTSITFWISTIAISGIPLFSGFFSKDEILNSLFFSGFQSGIYFVIWGVALITSLLTALYMTRLAYLTFNGLERFPKSEKPHESPAVMTVPLWILAVFAIFGGLLGLPYFIGHGKYHFLNHYWLGQILENVHLETVMEEYAIWEYIILFLSVIIAVGTYYYTRRMYERNGLSGDKKIVSFFGKLYPNMQGKFYFDELYQLILINPFFNLSKKVLNWVDTYIIDGIVNGTAEGVMNVGDVFRRLQTGLVQHYIVVISTGVVLILAYLIFG